MTILQGSRLELTEVSCFFEVLTRYWFSIGLQAQPRLTHLNISEASFFARFLWPDAATLPCCVNYSSHTVNAFRVQVENGLENVFFLLFRWFQSSLTYHDSCGPNWRLRSYSSQASEEYKLKAKCLFLSEAMTLAVMNAIFVIA